LSFGCIAHADIMLLCRNIRAVGSVYSIIPPQRPLFNRVSFDTISPLLAQFDVSICIL